MGKLLFILVVLFVVAISSIVLYEKVVHPFLFKEDLEDTLEDAVETKTRREVEKKANEILEGDDAS
jgi:hypothetical protein